MRHFLQLLMIGGQYPNFTVIRKEGCPVLLAMKVEPYHENDNGRENKNNSSNNNSSDSHNSKYRAPTYNIRFKIRILEALRYSGIQVVHMTPKNLQARQRLGFRDNPGIM